MVIMISRDVKYLDPFRFERKDFRNRVVVF